MKKNRRLHTRKGAAALPVIILLGGIIVEIGIAGAVLLFYLNSSLYGTKLANEALSLAQSGVNEAVRQIILNKSTSGIISLTLGNGTAQVDISQNCGPNSCAVTITSTGTVVSRVHTIVATLDVDSDTGKIDVNSILETP